MGPFAAFDLGGFGSSSSSGAFPTGNFSFAGFPGGNSCSSSSASRASAGMPPYVLPTGTTVTIYGLTQAAEHNGKVGMVAAWEESIGRYHVEVEGCSGVLSLRPRNLIQNCRIEIAGLEAKPELNGRHGQIFGFDEARGRYLVAALEGPTPQQALSLQPGNCVLPRGTRVIRVHRDAARYTVQCQNGRQIRIKYENVLC